MSELDFDGFSTFYTLWTTLSMFEKLYNIQYKSEACKFVRRVNQVVSSNLASSINRFRVHFLLGARYAYDIHTWVNFAMRKNVKELELNLSGYPDECPKNPFYLDSFSCYAGYPSVQLLVSLSLVAVSIGGHFLESVLFNFPNLERLTMKYLYCGHSDLNVVGNLLKLRHLEISCCYDYGKLEISAGNLISIDYFGYKEAVKFNYVPLLSEVSFSGRDSVCWIHNLHHSGFLSQLTKLTLNMSRISDVLRNPIGLVQFGILKQLEFSFADPAHHRLLVLTNLIDACPVLHKFKLTRHFMEFYWGDTTCMEEVSNVIKVAGKHHHCLKIFEMVGFCGTPADIELVLRLARLAIMFEIVILDPYSPYDDGKPSKSNPFEQIEVSKKQAKLLRNLLPARVQMKVL